MLVLLIAALLAHAVVAHAAAARPHILLMVLDDIGRTDTGIYGKANIPMPHIVSLANRGAVLENFYTQTVCSPTRSSLMVGRYPFRFGMQHPSTQGPGMAAAIPYDIPILPELLKKAGYENHAIGKWHCGYATWQHTPFFRGFSSYLGYLQGQTGYFKHNLAIFPPGLPTLLLDGLDFWRDDKPLWSAVGKYSLDLYDEEFTRVVDQYALKHDSQQKREDHPLFIYYAHQTVHIPLQPKQDQAKRCGHLQHKVRRTYCSMLVELDDSIGRTVQQLKHHQLWDNTLVLLTTDNGGMVNFDREDGDAHDKFPAFPASQGSNYPLRGSKTTLFDGGVRSLGFISGGFFPSKHAGQRYTGLAHVVDFSATVLAAAQLYPLNREQLKLDGHDLLPLLTKTGDQRPRSEVPINIINGGKSYSAIRFGKYKLIVKGAWQVSKAIDIPIDASKLVLANSFFDKNGDLLERMPADDVEKTLLFDLEKDEQERRNLAQELPDVVQHGLDLIASYVQSGQYMEPQFGDKTFVRAQPLLQGGAFRPFMREKEWRRLYAQEQRANGIDVAAAGEEEDAPLVASA